MSVTEEDLAAAAEARRAVMAWRREQRAALLAARVAMPTAAHREASRLIRTRLRTYIRSARPNVLGGYWPIRHEFNPLPCLNELHESGVRIALPMLRAKGEPLEFRVWQPGARMAIGAFEIAYPADGAPVLPDVLLVAMLGFDAAGYRLGYGGGYYDRTAATLSPRPRLIGIGFEIARLPSIRPLAHDIPMDCIITDAATQLPG